MRRLADLIDPPGADGPKKLAVFVTDSAANMVRAKELLVSTPGYEHIITIR